MGWMKTPHINEGEFVQVGGDGLPLPLARHVDKISHECPVPTATDVVNRILDRPIEWVDWKSLPEDARLQWSNDARSVLRNRAFISLCGKVVEQANKTNGELVKVLIESGVRYSETVQQMKDIRMTINGIELIRENLEKMLYQVDEPTMDDIHSAT